MKFRNIRYILAVILISFVFGIEAFALQPTDSIVFKAMKDEMKRSMQMKSKDYDTPSFIAYTYVIQNSLKILSQQGALHASDAKTYSDATWRLTMGDYQLNDENFKNDNLNGGSDLFYEISRPPIFPDYNGLRYSLWVMTNRSYNLAATNHKNKKEIIEKHNLTERDELLSDFSKEEPVELFKTRENYETNKTELERKSRIYSAVFGTIPEIKFSEAKINVIKNDIYYLNSEGTTFSVPHDITQLFVRIKTDFTEDSSSEKSLSVMVRNPEELPSGEVVLNEINKLVENIKESSKAESFKEDYLGPVLIEGKIVGDVLTSSLFSYDYSFNARRNDLVVEDFNKVYFEDIPNKLQFKIGEKILPDHISIVSYPRLNEYLGVKLLGSFDIDSEGVIPSDSLVLVENGILKNLFSSRIPTNVSDKSTGYRRFMFNNNQIGVRSGPGILHFKSDVVSKREVLKSELIRMAKEQGFEYAYILRSILGSVANLPGNCYRVNVETGEEVLVNDATFRYKIKPQELKNLTAVSDSTLVYNSFWTGKRYQLDQLSTTEAGLPVSLIIPSAILVENAEIRTRKSNKNLNAMLEEISNPLERTKNN